MTLLALLCFSLSSSFALPTPSMIPTDLGTSSSFFTRGADRFDTRSAFNIFWSCTSTIFACTWIAIHPNIPGPKDSQLVVFRRRAALMGYALIAPEIIILWALRQHRAARKLTKRYKERGWTMTHSFFLIMGGFTLHDKEGNALRILEYKELNRLAKAGKIKWPSITVEEIQEKSMGDYLSKGLVLVQICWFITQLIARFGYNLRATEFEIIAFTFTINTGITYYLWWHKPLNVRLSVPVHLLENENIDSEGEGTGSPAANPLSDPNSGTSGEPVEGSESTEAHIAAHEGTELLQIPPIVSDPYFRVSVPVYSLENEHNDSESILSGSPGPKPLSNPLLGTSCEPVEGTQAHSASVSRFLTAISGENAVQQQPLIAPELEPDPSPRGNPGPSPSNAIEPPSHNNSTVTYDGHFLLLQLHQLRQKTGIFMFPVATIITLFFAVIDAGSSNKLDRSVPLCVPTFYSPNAKSASGAGVASFSVAMIFLCTTAGYVMNGLPSLQAEVWLLAVIALPLVMGVVSLILETYNWMKKGPGRPGVVKLTRGRKFLEVLKLSVVLPVAIAIYLALKITLLILACIELGTLTHEGSDHTKLDAIRWTSFFPHMG